MIAAMTCFNISYDIPQLFKHWLDYYAPKFDEVGVALLLHNGDSDNKAADVRLLLQLYKNVYIINKVIYSVAPLEGVTAKNKIIQETISKNVKYDWVCPSDIDEFTEFPKAPKDYLKEADDKGANLIIGKLFDRVAEGGVAAAVTESSLERTFPYTWRLTEFEGRQTQKIVACKNGVQLNTGSHQPLKQATPLVYYNAKSPLRVNHFSWHEARLKQMEMRSHLPHIKAALSKLHSGKLPQIFPINSKDYQPIALNVPHIYTDKRFEEGWFTYGDFYKSCVNTLQDGETMVEVGSWKGRSVSFLAVEILNSGKLIHVHAVDTWEGAPNHPHHTRDPHIIRGTLYDLFLANIKHLRHVITPVKKPSLTACLQYEPKSLGAVFLDADHSYESVKAEIEAWLPKVKTGGIFAGHDIKLPGVKKAVSELLPTAQIDVKQDIWSIIVSR